MKSLKNFGGPKNVYFLNAKTYSILFYFVALTFFVKFTHLANFFFFFRIFEIVKFLPFHYIKREGCIKQN